MAKFPQKSIFRPKLKFLQVQEFVLVDPPGIPCMGQGTRFCVDNDPLRSRVALRVLNRFRSAWVLWKLWSFPSPIFCEVELLLHAPGSVAGSVRGDPLPGVGEGISVYNAAFIHWPICTITCILPVESAHGIVKPRGG